MQYLNIAALLFLMILPNACAGTANHSKESATLKVRLIWQGSQCVTKKSTPHATWIEEQALFKKMYDRLTSNQIGAQQELLSQVDFSREGILIVAMGQKPTAGFGLELNHMVAVVSEDMAVLRVSWIEPSKDAIVPQVITSPCLVIVLPKGPYSQIRLLDQSEHLRLQVHIK
jgi:hypothetical protein